MKTITLTESEVSTLHKFLGSNICRSGCSQNYVRISCCDRYENGKYKCILQRNRQSIMNKLCQ